MPESVLHRRSDEPPGERHLDRQDGSAPTTHRSRRTAGWLRLAGRALRAAGRHWLFTLLLLAGAALRLLVVLTFRPGLEFLQDSYDYILNAQHLRPSVVRPLLYPVVIRLVDVVAGMQALVLLQHLAGLLTAGLLYAALCRSGVRRWLAALAVAPLLLDGYQLDVEHFLLSETLFELLLAGLVASLLWNQQLSARAAALAGVCGAAFTLTRTVGLPVLVLAGLFLLVARVGRRAVVGFVAAAAVLLIGYGSWFAGANGSFGLQKVSGVMLAGRAMVVADCSRFTVPPEERRLCDIGPPDQRRSADWYTMHPASPLRQLRIPPGKTYDGVARDFAQRVIKAQPGDFSRIAWRDFRHYFAPGRHTTTVDFTVRTWQFDQQRLPRPWQPLQPSPSPYRGSLPAISGAWQTTVAQYGLHGEQLQPHLWKPGQDVLAGYQRYAYTQGPLLLACALIPLVAFGVGRRNRSPEDRRRRWAALFLAAAGVGTLLLSAITAVFEYRYVLPTLAMLPIAGALGLEPVLRSRAASRDRNPPDPGQDVEDPEQRPEDPSARLVSST